MFDFHARHLLASSATLLLGLTGGRQSLTPNPTKFVFESPRHKTDGGCRIVLSLSARLLRATMLSALARRAVPATANRLSSAPAASGARRAMGSAQSFVSFGAAVRCMRLVLLRGNRRRYSLHAHYQRFLPPEGGDPLASVQRATERWNQRRIIYVCMHAICLSVLNRSPFISLFSFF